MVFSFVSIFASGQIAEKEVFDSTTFDRNVVQDYAALINKQEDFGEDLKEVHLEFTTTGAKSAVIEMSSDKGYVAIHLLGETSPDTARKELAEVFTAINNPGEPVGEVFQLTSRPLALAILPDPTSDVRALSRYAIALAAAFFEVKSGS